MPEVFAFVRSRIDRRPRRAGQWLLTGSQESPLMRGVTESMAGRAAVLQLLPLSWRETPKVSLFEADLAPHADQQLEHLLPHPAECGGYLSASSTRHFRVLSR